MLSSLLTHVLHGRMSKQYPSRGLFAAWSALDDDPVLLCEAGCCDGPVDRALAQ